MVAPVSGGWGAKKQVDNLRLREIDSGFSRCYFVFLSIVYFCLEHIIFCSSEHIKCFIQEITS